MCVADILTIVKYTLCMHLSLMLSLILGNPFHHVRLSCSLTADHPSFDVNSPYLEQVISVFSDPLKSCFLLMADRRFVVLPFAVQFGSRTTPILQHHISLFHFIYPLFSPARDLPVE